MSALSNPIENAMISHTLLGVPYPVYGTIEVALFTTDPGEQGISGEVSGNAYARFSGTTHTALLFPLCLQTGVPTKTNALPIQFPTATGSWGAVAFWGVFEPTVNFTGTTTGGSAIITSITGSLQEFKIGTAITGLRIPPTAVVIAVDISGTQITISANVTGTGAVTSVALKGHTMIAHGPLTTTRSVADKDSPRIMPGDMVITMSNSSGGGLTDYAKRKILDHLFTAVVFPSPGVVYTAAGTGLVGDVLTEWTDAGYARASTTFSTPVDGFTSNSAAITLNSSVVSVVVPINAVGIFDQSTYGNALFVGNLSSAKTVGIGNSAKIQSGGVSATLS